MRTLGVVLIVGVALSWALLSQPVLGQAKTGPNDKKQAGEQAPKIPFPKKVPALPAFHHLNGKIIAFVADGSGDSAELSQNLREVVREEKAPVIVQRVKWCRFGEVLKDHVDHEAQMGTARMLAGVVLALKKDAPSAHIIFVGHSSGTRVLLAAAEMLPAGTLDRIFLLSPSVSTFYDLSGALHASRGGIDAFYSRDDGVLELAEDYVGTSDGTFQPSAGRVGFFVPRPVVGTEGKVPANIVAYQNLRQKRWRDDLGSETGAGGHFSWTQPGSLRNFVLPQFFYIPGGR